MRKRKRAANILVVVSAIAFWFCFVFYRWGSPKAGIYICLASLMVVLIAGTVHGFGWLSKNASIQ